jgi:hypothetical protein
MPDAHRPESHPCCLRARVERELAKLCVQVKALRTPGRGAIAAGPGSLSARAT